MLKINKSPTFKYTVAVNTAAIQGDFEALFEALPTDELDKLDDGQPGAWKKVLARVTKAFGAVEIEGESFDSDSPGALDKLTRWPGVGAAMLRAYYAGLWENTQGN
jgi:hypothetical protein